MNRFKFTPLRFILVVGLIHLLCASLSFAEPLSLAWKANLAGASSQDPQSSSKYIDFNLDFRLKYWLAPSVFFNLEPQVKYETGSFESFDGERKSESGIYFNEASAQWLFANASTFAIGALDQSTSHTALLMTESFPAARLRWQALSRSGVNTEIELKQAVPTSKSMNTETKTSETTPAFTTAAIALNYEPQTDYFWKNRLGAFRYENLPNSVAYTSSLRGNTVTSQTSNDALFVYQYEGLEGQSEVRFPVAKGWDFFGSASYLQNNKAPEKYNKAYSATVGSEFFFVGRKSLDLALTSFRIEPDASVASFSSAKYFYTNRVGYSLEAFLNFKKYDFKVGASYSEAELIFLSPTQSRENNLLLKMETNYANI